MQSPTKQITLFAADRTSHTNYFELEKFMAKQGKKNAGTDVRLDTVRRFKVAYSVRVGIEGFSEQTRRIFKKIPTNRQLYENLMYVFTEIRTPFGKPINSITIYMIGDLPNEGREAIEEFGEVLQKVDKSIDRRVTIFLSIAGLAPLCHTPLSWERIDPFSKFNQLLKKHFPFFEKISVAKRGGVYSPTMRLAQAMCNRGDERLKPLMYWLTTTRGRNFLLDASDYAGRVMLELIRKTGFPPEYLFERLDAPMKSEILTRPLIEHKKIFLSDLTSTKKCDDDNN